MKARPMATSDGNSFSGGWQKKGGLFVSLLFSFGRSFWKFRWFRQNVKSNVGDARLIKAFAIKIIQGHTRTKSVVYAASDWIWRPCLQKCSYNTVFMLMTSKAFAPVENNHISSNRILSFFSTADCYLYFFYSRESDVTMGPGYCYLPKRVCDAKPFPVSLGAVIPEKRGISDRQIRTDRWWASIRWAYTMCYEFILCSPYPPIWGRYY